MFTNKNCIGSLSIIDHKQIYLVNNLHSTFYIKTWHNPISK